MAVFKDLTGQRYGRLEVMKLSKKEVCGKRYRYYWLCKCECGNMHDVRTDSLTSGNVQSCGCLHKEQAVVNVSKHHSHKKSGTTIYGRWQKIKDRCFNPNTTCYSRYGGRGITLYEDWVDDFKAFYGYVSLLPHYGEKGYTLDRINNNAGYEPNNLRWATSRTQNRNRRSNDIVEYDGAQMTLVEASEKSDIPYACLRRRFSKGERGDKLFRPVKKKGTPIFINYLGRQVTLRQLSEITGINLNTLKTRYRLGKRSLELHSK